MKKIFLVLGVCGAMAATLSSCNNAAETEKLTNEQNAKIQSLVDEKLTALEGEVAAECDAEVLAAATAEYDALVAAAAKGGKKVAVKPVAKPKPVEAKKEEPKPTTVGNGKPNMNGDKGDGKVGSGKPNMDGGTGTPNTVGSGKPKM
jgi:hypothetical protein